MRPGRWGRYPPGAVLARAGLGGAEVLIRAEPDPLEVFPRFAKLWADQAYKPVRDWIAQYERFRDEHVVQLEKHLTKRDE